MRTESPLSSLPDWPGREERVPGQESSKCKGPEDGKKGGVHWSQESEGLGLADAVPGGAGMRGEQGLPWHLEVRESFEFYLKTDRRLCEIFLLHWELSQWFMLLH